MTPLFLVGCWYSRAFEHTWNLGCQGPRKYLSVLWVVSCSTWKIHPYPQDTSPIVLSLLFPTEILYFINCAIVNSIPFSYLGEGQARPADPFDFNMCRRGDLGLVLSFILTTINLVISEDLVCCLSICTRKKKTFTLLQRVCESQFRSEVMALCFWLHNHTFLWISNSNDIFPHILPILFNRHFLDASEDVLYGGGD